MSVEAAQLTQQNQEMLLNIIGSLVAILLALIAYIGNDVLKELKALNSKMVFVTTSITSQDGDIKEIRDDYKELRNQVIELEKWKHKVGDQLLEG